MNELRKDAVEIKWWQRQVSLQRQRAEMAEPKYDTSKKLDFSEGIPDEARQMVLRYMSYGYTYGELEEMLRYGSMTVAEANEELKEYMASEYGPKPTGKDAPPNYIRRLMPSGATARALSSIIPHRPGERKPAPADWPEGYVTRPGQEGFFEVTDILENWVGTPGSRPGTISVSIDPDDPAKMLKIAKMIQQGNLVYKQHEWRKTSGESVMRKFPVRIGPRSKRDVGIDIPMAITINDWGAEGQTWIPKGYLGRGSIRRPKELHVPADFDVRKLDKDFWVGDEPIIPFEGASPIDLGLGSQYTSARLLGDIEEEITISERGDPEKILRMVFEMEGDTASLQPSSKGFWTKSQLAETNTKRILRIAGDEPRAIAYLKRPGMLAITWWGRQPIEAWQKALNEVRRERGDRELTLDEVRELQWANSEKGMGMGRDLTSWFVQYKLRPIDDPYDEDEILDRRGLYTEERLHFRKHESALHLLPKGRFKATPVEGEGMEGFYDIVTEPEPMLLMDAFLQSRQGFSVKNPRLAHRELEILKRTSPELYEQIMLSTEADRGARENILGAALASVGLAKPPIPPVQVSKEDALGVIDRAYAKVIKQFSFANRESVHKDALARAILLEAKETWNTSMLQFGEDNDIVMSPDAVLRNAVEGALAGYEASSLGRRYAEAIKARASMSSKSPREAYDDILEAQADLATGKEFYTKMLSAYAPNLYGSTAYADQLLKSNEMSLPVREVLQRYDLKPGTAEAEEFERLWKDENNDFNPTSLVFRHPMMDETPFESRIKIIHPDVLEKRAGSKGFRLSPETPFAISEVLAAALSNDFDGDQLWAVILGTYKNGEIQRSDTLPLATEAMVKLWGEQRVQRGRADLARGLGGPKMPFGFDEETWAAASPLERLRIAIDPENMTDLGAEGMTRAMKTLSDVMSRVGKYFDLLEDVQRAADQLGGTDEQKSELRNAAKFLFEIVHGLMQTPKLLPEHLQRVMSVLESGSKSGNVLESPRETWKRGDWTRRFKESALGGPGAMQLNLVKPLLSAEISAGGEGDWIRNLARLIYPHGKYDEGEQIIARWRSAAERDREKMWPDVRESLGSIEDWMTQTPMGLTGLGLIAGRAGGERYIAEMNWAPESKALAMAIANRFESERRQMRT